MSRTLIVSDEVRVLVPGSSHLAVEAHGLANGPSDADSSALLDEAARRLAARLDGRAPHEDPHMAAWRAAYSAFGRKLSPGARITVHAARRGPGGAPKRARARTRQLVSASRASAAVGAVPPRCAGTHQVSDASLGRTG